MTDTIKLDNIKANLEIVGDGTLLQILPNQNGKIYLNWAKGNVQSLNVKIGENSTVEILEIGESDSLKINYDLDVNSNVKLNIFSKEKAGNVDYSFNLNENASLLVAYADFSTGKKLMKAKVNLLGRNANCAWHLASLSRDEDYKDYVVNFDHKVGETKARMDNYGVCKDKATLNFLGDAVIQKGAKKSSTGQNAKIMVFDPTCHAKASPILCIYENDVEAFHGASEGQINQEHVFYLTSRGLSEDEAKRLITFGYLYPIMMYFNDEKIKNEIEDCIVKRV